MKALRALIAALSPDRVIGVDGKIPWHYSGDFKRFKRVTMGATVIMGRHTWESIGKPLPGRRNVVITRQNIDGVQCFASLEEALQSCEGDVWFIGGARIYEEAMEYANLIDLTYVPDEVPVEGAVLFPEIDPELWEPEPMMQHEDEPLLRRQIFRRTAG